MSSRDVEFVRVGIAQGTVTQRMSLFLQPSKIPDLVYVSPICRNWVGVFLLIDILRAFLRLDKTNDGGFVSKEDVAGMKHGGSSL